VGGIGQYGLDSRAALPASSFVQAGNSHFPNRQLAVFPASVFDVQRGSALLRIGTEHNLNKHSAK
jgi:hypothetical protein